MEQLLITGGNGFVGRALGELAVCRGFGVTAAVRQNSDYGLRRGIRSVAVGTIDGATNWDSALDGISTVIHTAGRAHIMREQAADSLQAFRRTNTDGTRRLAEAAARHGVRRLILVSSIKVNGECTPHSRCFREIDEPSPCDAYGISKYEAELALREVAARTGIEFVIVRPPLVFGSGVRANFLSLMRLVDRGVPLPFGAVKNRRSLISVWNLADLLLTCVQHRNAAGQVFLAAEERSLSTAELVQLLAEALRRPARLVSLPPSMLRLVGTALGRSAEIKRLCDSLHIDATCVRTKLSWVPMLSLEEGMSKTAAWYRGTTSAEDGVSPRKREI